MENLLENMDRLFELYRDHIQILKSDVETANRRMGAGNPDDFSMPELSRPEFEQRILAPTRDAENRSRWLRAIVRGHEAEFPELIRSIGDTSANREQLPLRTDNSAA